MAEIELAALKTECLDRRISDAATLQSEVAAWETDRNEADTSIKWQFTTADARVKLQTLPGQARPGRLIKRGLNPH